MKVTFGANAIGYPEGGGHVWEYLNWALSLRSAGCEVVWYERVWVDEPVERVAANAAVLERQLEPYGLSDAIALGTWTGEPLAEGAARGFLPAEAVVDADLFVSLTYSPPVAPGGGFFRRSALIDIDPGLLQTWMSRGWTNVSGFDVYFTVGENIGRPDSRVPDGGVTWHYTPSCVALDWWRPHPAADGAAFTTVSHWDVPDEWMEDPAGDAYRNDKRTGFLPYLDLPRRVDVPLELALGLSDDEDDERQRLVERGWRVRHTREVASTPPDYQRYVAGSLGEFSCAKPSYVRLANAWLSNRTLCYLASGKPAVVEYTGPSQVVPDDAGVLRFRNFDEAVRCLEAATGDYERHSRLARALVEERFDGRRVAERLLERALAVPAAP